MKATQKLQAPGQTLWLVDGGDAEEALNAFARAGVDDASLAAQLQREGTRSSMSPGTI